MRLSHVLLAVVALASLGFEWEGRLSRLRRDLADADPARRREVVRLLASYPASDVREPILSALGDPDAGVRAEAAEAAGTVRLREAVPRLLDWIDDPDADVRASAARALGRIGEERAVSSLVRALGDVSADVRKAAVEALAAVGTAEVVVPLLGRLDDVDSSVRVDAAEALGRLRDARAVVPLVGRARDDAPEVRVAVYGALGDLGDARGLPALLQGLRDGAESAQLAAVAAAGRLGAEAAVEPLVALWNEPDPRRARAVVAALGGIGGEAALDAVVRSLARHQTRDVAAEVLASMAREGGRDEVVGALASALDQAASHQHATAIAEVMRDIARGAESADAEAALLRATRTGTGAPAAVLIALAEMGSADVLVPILERLRSEDRPTQQAALTALEAYFARHPADGRAADPLLAVLGRVDRADRLRVVRLLGNVGAARALPELRPLLEHDDPALRLAAVEAIGSIGDAEGAPVLLELLDDRDARTRFEAAQALETAASPGAVTTLVTRLGRREPLDRHAVALALGGALDRLRERGELPDDAARAAREALAAVAGGPDEGLAARAVDALGRWGDPSVAPVLVSLLDHPAATRRRAAAHALGAVDAGSAREALRAAAAGRDVALAAAAAASLGDNGEASDAARLLEVARSRPWPASAAASFGVARLARRGLLDAAGSHAGLCRAARSRDPYVRANIATAMAALEAPPCPDGPAPADWLGPRHAAPVRAAAARWLAAAARAGSVDAARARDLLSRCVRTETAPEVAGACEDPSMPPLEEVADVYAYSADGERLRANALVALRFADGSAWVAHTDVLGHLRLERAPTGRLVLDDPVSTPLDP